MKFNNDNYNIDKSNGDDNNNDNDNSYYHYHHYYYYRATLIRGRSFTLDCAGGTTMHSVLVRYVIDNVMLDSIHPTHFDEVLQSICCRCQQYHTINITH